MTAKPRRASTGWTETRTLHRATAFCACLLMLYLGVTGTWIQAIDLTTILSGKPESDPTMQSINEGKFGDSGYAVATPQDFGAATLPKGIDAASVIARALPAIHAAHMGLPDYVELRVLRSAPVIQAAFGRDLVAMDAIDHHAVAALPLNPPFPPQTLRQSLKEWHRFWARGDVPGVYLELLAGIVLWVLIVSGLTFYVRMLGQRRRIGRRQLLWSAGGIWRTLHRATSVLSAVFLVAVAFSGTFLGFESAWHTFQPRQPPAPPVPLDDTQIPRMTTATMVYARGIPMRVLRVRQYAGMEQGVVVTGEPVMRQIVFDLPSGRELSLQEPGYPATAFPFGIQVHETMKQFHSGYLFGLPARFMDLLAGLALVFLSVSGIWMYVDLYRKRLLSGRKAVVWK